MINAYSIYSRLLIKLCQYLLKVYPLEKFKTETESPVIIIIYRLFSIPLVLLFNLLKINPNLTTLISFVTLFVSGYFSIIGEFS